uniref:Solute carrier family 25 (Mitochondrial carrier, peroxisomal membrane protein), member 17 n=1 Tax=Nothobranchius korthausae TaxID=1143690 RepID=A0A1A8HH46_9TELE
MTVFFPLDTARLRLQVDENRKAKSTPAVLTDIIREEGLLAPYRGWFPVICSLCCSNFVYFYCFHYIKASWLKGKPSTPSTDLVIGIAAGLKRQLRRGSPRELSSLEVFVIGAIAKAVATAVTYPLQTIQSILRFGQFNKPAEKSKLASSLWAVKSLLVNRVRRYGMLGLFKGLEAKLLQTVLTAALMFVVYEKITAATFKVMGLKKLKR